MVFGGMRKMVAKNSTSRLAAFAVMVALALLAVATAV